MLILVLEASTTSAKVMLYDTKTNDYQVEVKAYGPMHEDITLHDAEMVFDAMTSLGREMAAGKKIDMIALSGTWHSLLLCDKQMKPQTPVYLWSHTGAAQVCKKLREDSTYVKDYYHKTGCMVNAIYPFFKLKMLEEKGFDLAEYYVMAQGSYNTYRLTGERVDTRCLASGSGLLNIHEKEYDLEGLKEIGISLDQLPRLAGEKEVFPLSKEGAEILGLAEGTPVIPTNSDGGLNQLGAGALPEGVMTLSVGTSGAMRMTVPHSLIPDEPSTWCYLSPKGWLSGAATSGCCNCIDWFRNKSKDHSLGYNELEAYVDREDDDLVFLPFIFGERCPGWDDEKTGGFIGIEPYHTESDMYRAIQEGILFNLYQCYQELIKINDKPKKIKLSGGILHSRRWTQMCADIFGVPMEVDQAQHSSILGGAVLAMEYLGVISDIKDFQIEGEETIMPNLSKKAIYEKKYQKYLVAYDHNSN